MIIQPILLDPSGALWTYEASNVSSPDPSGADWIDAEHPARNRKVVGLGELSQMGCNPPAVVERIDKATDTVAPGLFGGSRIDVAPAASAAR